MENNEPWRAPLNDLSVLNKESAKFLFDYAEKRLKHLLEVSDRTTNRAIAILTALIPLVGFLLSSLFKHYFNGSDNTLSVTLLVICWISVLVCLFSIVVLGVVGFPRVMHQMGREPKVLFVRQFIENDDFVGDDQYKLLLVVEAEDLQRRIDFMQKQSNRRIHLLKIGVLTIASYAILCFLTLVLLVLFR